MMKLYEFGINLPWGFRCAVTQSDLEPGLSEYAVEAWERMTTGGCTAHYGPGLNTPETVHEQWERLRERQAFGNTASQ